MEAMAAMASFRIGINMAGAISAGAYTAGVLDFLTEALDEWYKAKERGEAVPAHNVTIEVFSGASAGGMCAAISAVMLQEEFEHIHNPNEKRGETSNRFYESWVNRIDIKELLKTDDVKKNEPVISLLDSKIIESIAAYALTPKSPAKQRRYISDTLTLFLSLTNLRGVPYSLNSAAPGSVEETAFFFGDRVRFEISKTRTGDTPQGTVHYLNHSAAGAKGGWDVLQTAAMATGAFPVFLAPRLLHRYKSEYSPPHWMSVVSTVTGTPPPALPDFPRDLPDPFPTLNVDGGVTNNDPFNYAHDYLASLDPPSDKNRNPREPLEADRAVITIAPFPTTEHALAKFNGKKNSSIFWALPRLFTALIAQSRFFGESLSDVMRGTTFSRFVIAPSDNELAERWKKSGRPEQEQPPALQCASLGAFGGFFERGFRAHDYELGRRNCQKFLADSFVLPVGNVVIRSGLEGLDPEVRRTIEEKFKKTAPGNYADSSLPQEQQRAGAHWMPIIPLCTEALWTPIPPVERVTIGRRKIDEIVELIIARYKVVVREFIRKIPSGPFRFFLGFGQPAIRWLMRRPLRDALIKEFGDEVRG
jgi:hypothetical protein